MCPRGNSRRQDGCDSAIDRFRKSWVSEALTFGADYICIASLCSETCREEPCLAAVVDKWRCGKAHPVVLRLCRTSRAHWNPAGRFNARPTHKNISALPSCWCRMIRSNVHGHSQNFFFNFVFRKHVKSQMITNEGGRGITRNLFITKRSGRFPTQTQKCGYDVQTTPEL